MEVFEAAEFLQISSMGKACLKLIQEEGGPQQMEDLAYLISLSGIPEHQKGLKGGRGCYMVLGKRAHCGSKPGHLGTSNHTLSHELGSE